MFFLYFYIFFHLFFFIIKQTIGESAGGNLAAAITARNYDLDYVSLEDRIPINGLLLIYPPLSCQFHTQSYLIYKNYNPLLTKLGMIKGWKLYQEGHHIDYNSNILENPITNYTFQPLLTSSFILNQFPLTLFIIAKYDILQDDSLLFADRLRSLHVPVDVTIYNGTTHGFFGRFSSVAITSIITASQKLVQIEI